MATTKELDERLQALEQSKAYFRGAAGVAGAVLLIAVSISGWALLEVHRLSVEEASLYTLVTKKVPEAAISKLQGSQAHAAKTYTTAQALLQRGNSDRRGLSRSSARALGQVLAGQAEAYGGIPEYWNLAGFLIDIKSEPSHSLPVNCFSQTWGDNDMLVTRDAESGQLREQPFGTRQMTGPVVMDFSLSDCEFRLDDPAFSESGIAKKIAAIQQSSSQKVQARVHLDRVHVLFSGGRIIPVDAIYFTHCSFEFAVQGVPSSQGRVLGLEFLRADLSESFAVQNLESLASGAQSGD